VERASVTRVVATAILFLASRAFAGEAPSIRPGALELGLGASVIAAEGTSRAAIEARAGTFVGAPRGLLGFEVDGGWTHVRADDVVDALAAITWGGAFHRSAAHPFVGVVGGVRQEWLGSFRETRYPVGAVVGVNVLASERAALRVEWRVLKVLDDPVEDPVEHRVLAGISVFFRNAPPRGETGP
jgi:hypothetical protein